MPTIEIICIDQKSPSRLQSFPFAILVERTLLSHRQPSLFQGDFDKLTGCIYHLGGPSFKGRKTGLFNAYELLSRSCNQQESSIFFGFKRSIVPHIKMIVKRLVDASPTSTIVFTTDYQFSDNKRMRFKRVSLDEFWGMHGNHQIRFNASYEICGGPTA